MFFSQSERYAILMAPDGKGGGGSHKSSHTTQEHEKAQAAEHKGTQHSSTHKTAPQGGVSFDQNPQKAAEAGHKGGKARHKAPGSSA